MVVAQTETPRQLEKPVRNVLVYLIDTLRADHLKPFNAKTRVRTPGLDQLVVTGQRRVHVGAHAGELDQAQRRHAALLALALGAPRGHHRGGRPVGGAPAARSCSQEKGFHTGAFIANGYVSDKFGFKQGWDSYRNYIREGRYSRAEFLAADVRRVARQAPAEAALLPLRPRDRSARAVQAHG